MDSKTLQNYLDHILPAVKQAANDAIDDRLQGVLVNDEKLGGYLGYMDLLIRANGIIDAGQYLLGVITAIQKELGIK